MKSFIVCLSPDGELEVWKFLGAYSGLQLWNFESKKSIENYRLGSPLHNGRKVLGEL